MAAEHAKGKEEEALVTFLRRTKEGEYTEVEMNPSLEYLRVERMRDDYNYEGEYYYSVSN